MTWRSIKRRTVLKGLLGGGVAAVALPTLDLLLDDNGTAYADGTGLPQRFGLWSWGNGVNPDLWAPSTVGADWEVSEQLEPLAHVREWITVVSGLRVHAGNTQAHESGPAGFLTGHPLPNGGNVFPAPTIDQILAQEIGGETRFRSLEVGISPTAKGRSFNAPESQVPIERSPKALFNRVFGTGFTPPGEDPDPDPTVGLRRSVLDAISEDSKRLMDRVGAADRMRLEQHFDGIRELELRLARLEEAPPQLDACAAPGAPADEYPLVDARPPMREVNAAMSDILTMALACDQTRVFSLWYSDGMDSTLYPVEEATSGHHRLTHDEPSPQPQVNAITKYIVRCLGDTVERMSQVVEGDGTLLDNSVVLGTSDVSNGALHAITDIPVLLAGTACGRLKKGVHYRSETDENAAQLSLTLLQTMGVSMDTFGADEGLATEPLRAVENA